MLVEFGMSGKVMDFAVLDNEPAVGLEEIAFEDDFRQTLNAFQVVRRVGKDDVDGLTESFQKLEGVGFDGRQIVVLELARHLLNEVHAPLVGIYGGDGDGLAGSKFQTHISRAGKKVNDRDGIKEKVVVKDVEQTFLAQVGGGAYRKIGRSNNPPTFVFTSNYAHSY